eukprot:912946-Pyramimonas_sp.AAC.1
MVVVEKGVFMFRRIRTHARSSSGSSAARRRSLCSRTCKAPRGFRPRPRLGVCGKGRLVKDRTEAELGED